MRDYLKFRGHLTIKLQDTTGKLLEKISDDNFVVDAGKIRVAKILGKAADAGVITKMAIGDGGHDSDLYVPKTPDTSWATKTGLDNEITRKDNDSADPTYPDDYTVEFLNTFNSESIIDPFHTDPKVVNEAGLIIDGAGGEELFAIRTFKSVQFDPTDQLSLILQWRITIQ